MKHHNWLARTPNDARHVWQKSGKGYKSLCGKRAKSIDGMLATTEIDRCIECTAALAGLASCATADERDRIARALRGA